MAKLGYQIRRCLVTVEDMKYHTRIVSRRGNSRRVACHRHAPYLSYQASPKESGHASIAGAMLKAGAHAVKIEGGREMAPVIRALITAKIPVMGHVGMTPQSVHLFGGYKVQGRIKIPMEEKFLMDAKAVEKAGAFAIVLECIPAALGRRILQASP